MIPFDGTDEGRPVTARPVGILNTVPELVKVEISPEDPQSGGPSDIDGDDVTVEVVRRRPQGRVGRHASRRLVHRE